MKAAKSSSRKHIWLLGAGAACLLVFALVCTLISRQFIYGVGHESRPIPLFLLAYAVGWLGFLAGCFALLREREAGRRVLAFVMVVGVTARLIMATSSLIQENDCYRYVLDGHMVLAGVNPYAYAPKEHETIPPRQLAEAFETPAAKQVLSRIGYPQIPTLYPPVAQWAFAIGARLTAWSWHGQRAVFLLADLLTMLVGILLLRARGKPLAWIALYAWNPLVIKEIANSTHLESLVALFLVITLLALTRWSDTGARRWLILAAVALAGGILSKLYPLLLVPICLAWIVRCARSLKPAVVFVVVTAALCAFAYTPFLDYGYERLTEAFRIYNREWVRNAGAFAVVRMILPYPRIVCTGLVAATVLALAVRLLTMPTDADRLAAAFQMALFIWFMFLPAAFPWYSMGFIAVSIVRPRYTVVMLSGLFGLYYMNFFFEYNDMAHVWNVANRAIQHGFVWAVWVVETLQTRRELGIE